jgi:hypothetical protein
MSDFSEDEKERLFRSTKRTSPTDSDQLGRMGLSK